MKPYLISIASYTKGVDDYLRTLPIIKDQVEWVSLEFLPYFPKHKFKDALVPFLYPGHLGRFLFLAQAMLSGGLPLDPNRMWIFTDTGDVIFQSPILDLPVDDRIYITNENIIHKDADWWRQIALNNPTFKPMLDWPVYNMGTVAMKGTHFLDLFSFMAKRVKALDRDLTHYYDQPIFNYWLQDKKDLIVERKDFMCTLYNNMDSIDTKEENGTPVYYLKTGEKISIVHKNGGTKNS